jgi:hypothetical protein
MTGDADRSDAKIEAAILEGIRKVRADAALSWFGECHYCAEPVPAPQAFCGSECRDDYERIKRAERILGRRI